ncbi:hypothetical protein KZZ52_58640 [Dactylosporangium sp. AC04546]|uniref:hypothetical protein n=1 Tax=Dactylosporangium sp. AC04546 TaxID=2862460 RepID=UPI001EE0B0C0|nr:hypothetical protein [Dactylosporangium sp. AC04546]WVK83613.1 hypothetical protein KZZ52_58640 [Dactylosporangium sp. AC04546]
MRGRLFPVAEDWYEWRQDDPPLAGAVQVRIGVGAGGRLVLTGLRIEGTPSAELLRAIPVGRIEAAANAQLAVVDAPVGTAPVLNTRARPIAPPMASDVGWEMVEPALAVARAAPSAAGRMRGRPDVFYREVADVYLTFAQASPRPACDLADQHGVPVSTAHRWVKEARRRGFLPPGRPGKSG